MGDLAAGSWERLSDEHEALYESVRDLAGRIHSAKRSGEGMQLKQQMKEMRVKAHQLINALDRHGDWETQELFPQLVGPQSSPEDHILVTSLWMLEKEHELVHEYFESFFSGLNQWPANPCKPHLERTLDYLDHACRLVQEHLMMEEELLVPMMPGSREAVSL